jgi:Ni2+-binding GTPase involved in maturation of urease and hydrogenase
MSDIVTLQAPVIQDKKVAEYDFSQPVSLLTKVLCDITHAGVPALIGIYGKSGSGKTELAKHLQKTAKNSVLIDVISHLHQSGDKEDYAMPLANIMAALSDTSASTFLIDDLGFATRDCETCIEHMTQHQSKIVLFFVQNKRDVKFTENVVWLKYSDCKLSAL